MNVMMEKPDQPVDDALPATLLANLGAFQGFARRRLGDDELAADAVQESLLRALQSGPKVTDDQNLLPWFYRVLRNVITDLHRRRVARAKALERYTQEAAIQAEDEADLEATACACFRALLPTLRPEYAEVLQLADLDGEPAEAVAERMGISRNNLNVRLHRARRQLRQRLEQTCQLCAKHGCLDCTCTPNIEQR